MTTLILSENPLEDEGAALIAEGLSTTETIRNLQIAACDIGFDGVQMIADALTEREDCPVRFLKIDGNEFEIESEIILNDLRMNVEDLRIEWKDKNQTWTQSDIDAIVEHYTASDILHNLLEGNSLAPLIDDNSLLGAMEIEDDEILGKFVDSAFEEENILKGLEMVICMVRKGLPPNDVDEEFLELENEELYVTENDLPLEDHLPLTRILHDHIPSLLNRLKQDEPKKLLTPNGEINPFGPTRLRIIELLITMMDEENSEEINIQILKSLGPVILLELMCKFPLHSILHRYVVSFIRMCLRSNIIRPPLFENFRIIDFLIAKATPEWFFFIFFNISWYKIFN